MKIYIFGVSGSGKTTIAKNISQELNIPHFDIDQIFWNFEKGKKDDNQREKKILDIISENDWILEGMYRDKWIKNIAVSASFIFILKPSKIVIYWRIFKRTISRMLGFKKYERSSNLKILFGLFKIVKDFNRIRLPEFLSIVREVNKKPIFIKNSKQLLQNLSFN